MKPKNPYNWRTISVPGELLTNEIRELLEMDPSLKNPSRVAFEAIRAYHAAKIKENIKPAETPASPKDARIAALREDLKRITQNVSEIEKMGGLLNPVYGPVLKAIKLTSRDIANIECALNVSKHAADLEFAHAGYSDMAINQPFAQPNNTR